MGNYLTLSSSFYTGFTSCSSSSVLLNPGNHSMEEHSCTRLREVVSSVYQLKVAGMSIIEEDDGTGWVRFRCSVDGHGWEIR